MSRRGRKVNTSRPDSGAILKYFSAETSPSPTTLAKAIIENIVDKAFVVVTSHESSKKHDGTRVSSKTYELWKKSFPWLEITDQTFLRCTYCRQCKLKHVWADEGTPNVQKSSLERHNSSKDHVHAAKMHLRQSINTDEIELDTGESNVHVQNADTFLFRTVYAVAKHEMPSEKVNGMLELQALNGCDMRYQHLSWTTIGEIQQCISTILKRSIVDEINTSDHFSLMLDESTDISVEKHLSICIRYVKNGEPCTKFLANVKVNDGCATTIVNALYDCVSSLGIDMSKCVSLATDGASVMLGKKTGVGVQVKAKYSPFAIQTHCFAHRLNLALVDSIKKIETLKTFRDKFGALYTFMSGSPNRTSTLRSIQQLLDEPELAMKQLHSIRWLGLRDAVYAVYMCYASVLTTLSKFAGDNPSAKGLYKYFSTYKVALLLGFMLDIHTELGTLSCHLQKQELLFSEVPPLVDSILGRLDHMQTSDGEFLSEMKQGIEIKDDKASYGGEDLKNYGEAAKSQFEILRVEYIANITRNMKQRFRKENTTVLDNMAHVFEPLTVTASTDDSCIDALKSLGELYGSEKKVKLIEGDLQCEGLTETVKVVSPLLDKDALIKEWTGFCAMIKGSYSRLTVSNICKRLIVLQQGLYPNMSTLAKIALCLMVTSVECERSFSYQNRLKTKFRGSLKCEKLAILMNIVMCGPAVQVYDPVPACRLWLAKKRRKGRLVQEYAPRKRAEVKKC